jgi:uncharacterized protein (DUF2267 family)
MQYDEFIGQVQHRARLAATDQAVRATRATLETLGERLFGGEADDLAAQLPEEIGIYLRQAQSNEKYSLDEFFKRVSEREGVELPDAVHHARAVISVLCEAVTPGELQDVRAQLPDEFDPLFEAGSEGNMNVRGQ